MGLPNEVVDKMLRVHDIVGNVRIGMQLDFGGIDPALTSRSIELLATEVIPQVNAALAESLPLKDPLGGSSNLPKR